MALAELFNVWAESGSRALTGADRKGLAEAGASGNIIVSDAAPGHISLLHRDMDRAADMAQAEDAMRSRIEADDIAFQGMAAAYRRRMEARK